MDAQQKWIEGLELRALAQDARHRQRLERGADDMRCTHTIGIVWRLGRKELGMGEDDAQLIIEAMKESGKIARFLGGRAIFSHGPQKNAKAFRVVPRVRRPSWATTSASRQADARGNR